MQSATLRLCLNGTLRTYVQRNTSKCRHHSLSTATFSSTSQSANLTRHLRARIKSSGPITISEYMKEVLTNPVAGYYMNRDVFGSQGDFTTSPEISQMFGELLGVWCLNEWMQIGLTEKIQVVELGPGRGTLADDMLRTFTQFADVKDNISIHFVEVSPTLSQIQESKLTGKELSQIQSDSKDYQSNGKHYKHCISKYGQPVFWYKTLQDVPRNLSCFIAHEFLDALPIYKFQKTNRGWCEVLVDYVEDTNCLKLVLSPGPTAAVKSFLQVPHNDARDHVEVCPEAGLVVQEIAQRIISDKGFALLADYGHSGEKSDTFRGFKNHQLHDVLVDPGTADLTADVDFSYLKNVTRDLVKSYGPLTQQQFLHNMGIGVRLQVLLEKAPSDSWKDLISGYDMLTNPNKMGERFKFLALMNPKDDNYVPAGFVSPEFTTQNK